MIDEQLHALTGAAWDTWVEVNYRLGKDPTVHGAAQHLVTVARRRHEGA